MTNVTDYEKVLQKILFEDQLPITYRLLSRELNINQMKSHEILENFYQEYKEKLEAYYVLSYTKEGIRKYEIVKSEDPKLLEIKKMDNSSALIYSLSMIKNLKIEEIISGVESKIYEEYSITRKKDLCSANYESWGILKSYIPLVAKNPLQTLRNKNGNNKHSTSINRSISVGSGASNKSTKITSESKKVSQSSSILSRYISRKSENGVDAKDSIAAGAKRSKTEPVSNAKRSNDVSGTRTTTTIGSKNDLISKDRNGSSSSGGSGFKYVSRKIQSQQQDVQSGSFTIHVKKLPAATSITMNPIIDQANRVKIEQQRKDLESMFDDDDNWGKEDEEIEKKDGLRNNNKTACVNHEESEVLSAKSANKSLISVKPEPSQQELTQNDSVVEIESQPKFETYVDKDGFMVTNKNVDSKVKSQVTSKKHINDSKKKTLSGSNRVGKKNNGSKKPMKQSTLMKFFK